MGAASMACHRVRIVARLFLGRSGVGNPLLDLGCERFTPEGVEHGSAVERFTPPPGLETRETLLFGAACALLLAAKLLALVYYRIDSDEPQHLHVVWNWLHVGVGYRDFFDNHTPLFHLMCVPVLALVGEQATTLLTLRLVSLVSYLGALVLAAALARTFTTPRLARWSALLLGAFPPFFLVSTEYRPDVLWALLWLAFLNVLVRSDWRGGRVFGAFLVLGANFCVSMKSTLMLVVLLFAMVVCISATRRDLLRPPWSSRPSRHCPVYASFRWR
jgi:4-amino-4-deoxy-L-arabinose transferase-like glycosyltransferase